MFWFSKHKAGKEGISMGFVLGIDNICDRIVDPQTNSKRGHIYPIEYSERNWQKFIIEKLEISSKDYFEEIAVHTFSDKKGKHLKLIIILFDKPVYKFKNNNELNDISIEIQNKINEIFKPLEIGLKRIYDIPPNIVSGVIKSSNEDKIINLLSKRMSKDRPDRHQEWQGYNIHFENEIKLYEEGINEANSYCPECANPVKSNSKKCDECGAKIIKGRYWQK